MGIVKTGPAQRAEQTRKLRAGGKYHSLVRKQVSLCHTEIRPETRADEGARNTEFE
jgi:hypothetical protein